MYIPEIANSIVNPLLAANEYIFLSKKTPENLERLNRLSGDCQNHKKFKTMRVLCRNFIRNLLFIRRNAMGFQSRQRPLHQAKCLALSHYFASSGKHELDPFYGLILKDLHQIGQLQMLYLDHVDGGVCGTLIDNHDYVPPVSTFSPIRIKFIPAFKVLLLNLKFAISIFFLSLVESNPFKSLELQSVALEQTDVRTLRSLLIADTVMDSVLETGAQHIWLTLEGHPYERYLISRLRTELPNVEINGYQHAPLVLAQVGFFEILKAFGEDINIYTSGTVTQEYLRHEFPEIANRIQCLGSSKFSGISEVSVSSSASSESQRILFLPEGTIHALSQMYQLASDLLKAIPELQISIRPHPRTPRVELSELMRHAEATGILFSTAELEQDATWARYIVYRSSSAAIEALSFHALPICLSDNQVASLDPLVVSNLKYPVARDSLDLIEVVRNLIVDGEEMYFSPSSDFLNFPGKYFSPPIALIQ